MQERKKPRAVELAEKLKHEENARLRTLVPQWIQESEDWAKKMLAEGANPAEGVEGHRLRYVLNHLAPSLHHFYAMPNPSLGVSSPAYIQQLERRWRENTQAEWLDDQDRVVQAGVVYDAENFAAFCEAVKPYCTQATGSSV